jgi:hypothetical protein
MIDVVSFRPMLTEKKNFRTTKLDVSFIPSDKFTCLQSLNLKGPMQHLLVYDSSTAMPSIASE